MPAVKPLVGSNAGRWDVTVTIYAANGTTLATVYSDADGDDVGANPLPGQRNTGDFGVDTSGNWTCYVVPGDYQVGVRPHGGSETKTPVTVAADVADPTTVLGLVHGVRADGDVPVWNETRQRLEWGSGSAASVVGRWYGYADTITLPAAAGPFTFTSPASHDDGVIVATPAGAGQFAIDAGGGTYVFELSLTATALAGIGQVFAQLQVATGPANQLADGDSVGVRFTREVSTGFDKRVVQHTSSPIDCAAGASLLISFDSSGSAWTGGDVNLFFTATKVA